MIFHGLIDRLVVAVAVGSALGIFCRCMLNLWLIERAIAVDVTKITLLHGRGKSLQTCVSLLNFQANVTKTRLTIPMTTTMTPIVHFLPTQKNAKTVNAASDAIICTFALIPNALVSNVSAHRADVVITVTTIAVICSLASPKRVFTTLQS